MLSRETTYSQSKKFSEIYKDGILNSISHLKFSHAGTLKFNKFTSIERAKKAVEYLFSRIEAGLNNYGYFFERKHGNIHIHLAYDFKKSFFSLYNSSKKIEDYIYSIWNNEKVKNGAVWIGEYKSDLHHFNYLGYILKEILPHSTSNFSQKQIDQYYIHKYDIPTQTIQQPQIRCIENIDVNTEVKLNKFTKNKNIILFALLLCMWLLFV